MTLTRFHTPTTVSGLIGLGKLLCSTLSLSAGKSQLGVTFLNLEMTPAANTKMCYSDTAQIDPGKLVANDVSVEIDPTQTASVQMNFVVGDLLPGNQDYMVLLAYSPAQTASPPLLTPLSDNKLLLDLNGLEILGAYSFPKTTEIPQAVTQIGQAQSKARQKFLFTINLSTDSIPKMIRVGQNKIFLQALAVHKNDFDRGIFDSAILTKVNTISFLTAKESESRCSSSDAWVSVDDQGGKTIKAAGLNNSAVNKSGASYSTGVTKTNNCASGKC